LNRKLLVEFGLPRKRSLLDALFDTVVVGDVRKARKIAEQIVGRGLSVNTALEKMTEAMNVVDKRYERKEYFVVDVAAAASAMQEAFKVLEPHLQVEPAKVAGKVVIGSLKGNVQGIGKNIVAATLRAAGFQVVDLGVDVSPEAFVDMAVREGSQIIAISILVDETVPFLKDMVALLQKRQLSEKIKIVVGGRAVSEQTLQEYGVHAYAKDAWDCVRKVKSLLSTL